jgi:hypothetical protein
MKHLAAIQKEFLKEARKWDRLTLEEQKAYLKRHRKSKRRLTAKPSVTDRINRKTKKQETTNDINMQIKALQEKRQQLEEQSPMQKATIKMLEKLSNKFKIDGFEVQIEKDRIHVENKNGYSTTFIIRNKDGKFNGFNGVVEGYSNDIPLDDVGRTYKDLKEIAKAINSKWMKEYDENNNKW